MSKRLRVLAVPARDRADEIALEMLRKLLDPLKWDVAIVGVDVLSAEVATLLDDQRPDILCLGVVLPGGLTRIRYLCKRLRKQFPELRIVVGIWGTGADSDRLEQMLLSAGADHVETTLLGLVRHLDAWRPAMEQGNHRPEAPVAAGTHA